MEPRNHATATPSRSAALGRGERLGLAAAFALGLALRLAHLATIRESPFSVHLMLDPALYDEWGARIAAGLGSAPRPFFQDPLYAYVLGAIYAVAGHARTPVVLLQALLGACVPVLLYAAARRWVGRVSATVAAALALLYAPSIYYEGLILKTSLAMFLVVSLLWLVARALATERRREWIAAGVVLGLACLTRGNLVLFVPVLAAWLLLDRARAPVRRRVRAAALVLLGALVVLGAVAVRNRVAGGEWVLTTSNAGQNFFIGNNPLNRTGEYERLPFVDPNPKHEETGFAREAQRRTGRTLSASEVSRFWMGQSWAWIRSDPAAWLGLLGRKLRAYWGAYEIPDNLDYYLYRETAPVLRLPLPGFGLVAPLGLLGALLSLRRRGWVRLLLLFVAVYSLSVVAFFVFSRFRMPMLPALFVLAGIGATETVRRCRAAVADRRAVPRALGALGLLLVLWGVVLLPVRGRADDRGYRLARALGLPARLENSAVGHYNLGLVYAARAKSAPAADELLALAEGELRRAAGEEPRDARIRNELGKVLARQGRNREAIEVYRRAAALDPSDFRPHHALGLLHRRLGENEAAAREFLRAAELAPGYVASARALGRTLLDLGRPDEAAIWFRRVLERVPDDAVAREGLRAAGQELSPSR